MKKLRCVRGFEMYLVVTFCLPLLSAQTPELGGKGNAIPSRPLQISSSMMKKFVASAVQPTYPPLARKARVQGTVCLEVLVSKDGDVEKLDAVTGHPLLVPAAIETVKSWKFKSYLLNGQAIEFESEVFLHFNLSGSHVDEDRDLPVSDVPGFKPGAPNEARRAEYDQQLKEAEGLQKSSQALAAMDAAKALTKVDPNRWEAYFIKGDLHRKQNELRDARTEYLEALDLAPERIRPRIAKLIWLVSADILRAM